MENWGTMGKFESLKNPVLTEVLDKIDEILKWNYTVRSQTLNNEIRKQSGAAIDALLLVKSFIENQIDETHIKELLSNLYKKVHQYCYAKYGNEPEDITITKDGEILVSWTNYVCGDVEGFNRIVDLTELGPDLEQLIETRKRLEEEKLEKERIEREEKEKARLIIEKEERRILYLSLKKEFEIDNN